MSKKNKKNEGRMKPLNMELGQKKFKKTTNLRSVLQSIYNDYANLETTCNHNCTCCNVAMPQMNYSEFVQLVTVLWNKLSKDEKTALICTSVDYFFRNEYSKWDMATLIKPCMLLDSNGLCKSYDDRPLNCRLYGLWPSDEYTKRVDKFEKVYSKYGLKREDLPLNTQCPNVKRKDESVKLDIKLINDLFTMIDNLDKEVGGFTNLQVEQKENYRTFHDWLLLKIYGEKWLTLLTTFMLAATKEQMEDQVLQLKKAIREKFSKDDLPDISASF